MEPAFVMASSAGRRIASGPVSVKPYPILYSSILDEFPDDMLTSLFDVLLCADDLHDLFRYEVFKLLKSEGKITDCVIENMTNWRHSGFSVYFCGRPIWPHNDQGLENLARYIIRASFSHERMSYLPAADCSTGTAKVVYKSKDKTTSKTFSSYPGR